MFKLSRHGGAIQKTQIKLLGVKIMSEILKYTDWINSGLDSKRKKISELERQKLHLCKMKQRENRALKNNSISELWDNWTSLP